MDFDKFDMNNFQTKSTTLIIGSRCTGKTTLCLDIIRYKLYNIKYGLVFARNEKENPVYSDIFPSFPIYPSFDSNKIYDLLKTQKNNNKKKILVIIDDVLFNEQDENLIELICNGKDLNISTIIISQFPFFTSYEIRKHFQYIFLFNVGSYLNDRISKCYNINPQLSKKIFKTLKTLFNCILIYDKIYNYHVNKNLIK